MDLDVKLVRLVMAGMPKEWLWLKPGELGLTCTEEGFEAAPESPEAREKMERMRIEVQRVALLLWWKTGRPAVVRTRLARAARVLLLPIGRLVRPDGRAT